MPTEERAEKTIAFVLYPGLTVLDLTGPLQVLTALSEIAPEYRTVVVAERAEPTDTDIPGEMKVIPNNTFEEVPHPFAFIVPGGVTPTLRAMSNEAIRSRDGRGGELCVHRGAHTWVRRSSRGSASDNPLGLLQGLGGVWSEVRP